MSKTTRLFARLFGIKTKKREQAFPMPALHS